MPGGDRTGPGGMGPMTGRAAGYCTGNTVPGYMNPSGGRGMGFRRGFQGGGRGFGRGVGFGAYAPPVAPMAAPVAPVIPQPGYGVPPYDEGMELDVLRQQAQAIEASLSGIQKRIETLEAQNSAEEKQS